MIFIILESFLTLQTCLTKYHNSLAFSFQKMRIYLSSWNVKSFLWCFLQCLKIYCIIAYCESGIQKFSFSIEPANIAIGTMWVLWIYQMEKVSDIDVNGEVQEIFSEWPSEKCNSVKINVRGTGDNNGIPKTSKCSPQMYQKGINNGT